MAHVAGGTKNIRVPREGGSGWENPVANGPLAAYSAANPAATLSSSGIHRWFNNTRLNQEIPNSGGQRGFLWEFNNDAGDPLGAAARETRWELSVPKSQTYEYFKIWQPANYFHRGFQISSTTAAVGDFADWQDGDVLVRTDDGSNNTAIFRYAIDKDGTTLIFCSQLSTTDAAFYGINGGATIQNSRNLETFTSTGRPTVSGGNYNNKLSAMWVDDGDAGNGYQNGAMTINILPVDDNVGDYGDSVLSKMTAPSTESHSGSVILDDQGRESVILDKDDNGSAVEFIVYRKRSTTLESDDAEFAIWRKSPSTGDVWIELLRGTGGRSFTTAQENKFTHGYFMGTHDSGYEEDTAFYLMEWQLRDSPFPQLEGL